MPVFALQKYLLGLAFVGVICTVSSETSLNSSASIDRNATVGARERREKAVGEIMTNEERKEWLSYHNDIRRDMTGFLKHEQPVAANMDRMYWNALLEADAIAWSKMMCESKGFVHGHPSGFKKQTSVNSLKKYDNSLQIGQNIYKGGEKSAAKVIMAYAKETFDYHYDPAGAGTCTQGKLCGHYKQIVWHDSLLVGCGYALCGNIYFSTCNYMGPANWPKTPPYTSGTPCSLCAADKKYSFHECEDQLCVPKDRCSPVTECTVVDTVNCLCDESSYKELVESMVKTLDVATATISAGPPFIVYGLLLPLAAILLGHGVQLG